MICQSKTNLFFLGGQKGPSVSHPEIHRNPEIRNPCMHTSSTGSQSHWVIPNDVIGAGLLWTTGDSFIHRSASGQGGKKQTRNWNCCFSRTDNTVCKLLILFKCSWKSHNSDISSGLFFAVIQLVTHKSVKWLTNYDSFRSGTSAQLCCQPASISVKFTSHTVWSLVEKHSLRGWEGWSRGKWAGNVDVVAWTAKIHGSVINVFDIVYVQTRPVSSQFPDSAVNCMSEMEIITLL